MDLPFDALPGAHYIKEISPDIVPPVFREYQQKMNVPCLCPLGCRFLALTAGMKQPVNAVDIGCGIGASTISMHMGAPDAYIIAVDANLDRYNMCRQLLGNISEIDVEHMLAVPFLLRNKKKFDFAFVDTIKKDYMHIWHHLREHLAPCAVVVFDDVLLHGYTTEEVSTVPFRYRDGRNELRAFLEEMEADKTIQTQIIPIGGGMLLVRLKS